MSTEKINEAKHTEGPLEVKLQAKDERIAELNADKVQLENDACVARGEIDRLTADRDSWFKTAQKKHAQLKANDERIAELEKYHTWIRRMALDIDRACQDASPCTWEEVPRIMKVALRIARQHGLEQTLEDEVEP